MSVIRSTATEQRKGPENDIWHAHGWPIADDGVRKRGQDATLLLVINGFHDVVEFIVPEWPEGAAWKLLIDTNVTHASVEKQIEFGNTYQVTGQSLLLLLLQTA